MNEKRMKSYFILLLTLSLVLATAVCAQALRIRGLQAIVGENESGKPNIRIHTQEERPQPADPGLGSIHSPQVRTSPNIGLPLNFDSREPFGEMRRMREEIDRMFGDAFTRFDINFDPTTIAAGFSPSLDLSDEGDHFVVRVDLPGANKSDIEVNLQDRTLTVSGKREELIEERDEDDNFLRRERRSGHFQRSLTFPEGVRSDSVSAEYRDGVLEISVPKAEAEDLKSKTIEIK